MHQGWGSPPQGPPGPPSPSGPSQGGFGPPHGGYGAPQGQYPAPQQSAGPLAIGALVLAIVSWFGVGMFASIPGAIMGKVELGKIESGQSPAAGKQFAQIGMWLSIANAVLYIVIFGGMCLFYIVFFMIMGAAGVAQHY